jgi:hypothetical protein
VHERREKGECGEDGLSQHREGEGREKGKGECGEDGLSQHREGEGKGREKGEVQ